MAGRASAMPADSTSPMTMRASDAARKPFRIMLLRLISFNMEGPERVRNRVVLKSDVAGDVGLIRELLVYFVQVMKK